MPFISKMLIVLQVVLSLMFMAFAGAVYTTQQNWMDKARELEGQVSSLQTDLTDQNTRLQRELDTARQTMSAAVERAQQAEGENAQFRAQLANEVQQSNRRELELSSLTGLAQAKANEATFRDEEAQRERVASQTLRSLVNDLQANLRDRDDQIFGMTLQLDDLGNRFNTLLGENGDLKKVLRQHDLPTDPSEYTALEEPPPPIDGLVVDTKADKTNRTAFVEISVGSDDGIRKNHVLDVYSTGLHSDQTRYLGKIRIVDVSPDRAVGTVIQAAKNGIIQRGDNVTTRL